MMAARSLPRPFMLLVKPASADCNLRCRYCFYLEKAQIYPGPQRHRMSRDVLERLIGAYMKTSQPAYTFCWQGGEPTLMGLEFFRAVTDLQKKHGRPGSVVANSLQTNAMLIDEALARHLGEYRFLVGCSLDGPAELHDRYRVSAAGLPSHDLVMRGVRALWRHDVAVNALVLVSQANVRHAREVFRHLVHEGFLHQQYIPCVEFDLHGASQPFSISGPEWGDFLCELFDEWSAPGYPSVSIRHFDAVLQKLAGGESHLCTLDRDCRQYLVIEHNGDIYPCDFFVEPPLRLGNIMETSFEQALTAEAYRVFGARKAAWNPACQDCGHLDLCAGDCLKNRYAGDRHHRHLSWLCAGWRQFYDHARPRLAEWVARSARPRDREAASPATVLAAAAAPVGRNDPCPCGSGLKYKKCCGTARRLEGPGLGS